MEKIMLYVVSKKNKSKDGKQEWVSFRTQMNLIVAGEEDKGLQHVWVDVILKDKEEKAKIEKMKGRIKITCNDVELTAPTIYKVKQIQQEDGSYKNQYPKVFINHVLEAVEAPKPVPQSSFTVDEIPEF